MLGLMNYIYETEVEVLTKNCSHCSDNLIYYYSLSSGRGFTHFLSRVESVKMVRFALPFKKKYAPV